MIDTNSHGIILFDGACVFCRGSVSFIANRDRTGYFRFGASQTPAAQQLLRDHGIDGSTTRSIVLIERGRAYSRSTASLRIAQRLPFPWNLTGVFLLVPQPIRDAIYNLVAAIRHRIAGEAESCDIPPPAIKDRLI